MSLAQFLRILIARRWIILVTLFTCVAVALAVARILPERYPAKARVMLDIVKPDPVTGQIKGNSGDNNQVGLVCLVVEAGRAGFQNAEAPLGKTP